MGYSPLGSKESHVAEHARSCYLLAKVNWTVLCGKLLDYSEGYSYMMKFHPLLILLWSN